MADPVHGPTVALTAGLLAIPLWALSYVWLPFRHLDLEPAWVWPAVIVGEIGAVVASIVALVVGIRARRRASGAIARRRAGLGAILGTVVLALVVGLNVLWTFFIPI